MQILRASDYRTTPWKNGGGVTTEIIVNPPGAGLEDFDWRVSMATIASDGPFSRFPGIDRTLAVLDGAGLRLMIGEGPAVLLTAQTQPFDFVGDLPTRSELVRGPITDLNLMVRRDSFARRMTRLTLDAPKSIVVGARIALLFCAEGVLGVETPEGVATLAPRDALCCNGGSTIWGLNPETVGLAYVLEVEDHF